MLVSIDRFENGLAVVELPDGSFAHLPIAVLPDAKEGDVVEITINHAETQKRKEDIAEQLKDLFGKA